MAAKPDLVRSFLIDFNAKLQAVADEVCACGV